ncbi:MULTISPECIES: hypothetical protein [unclassified Nocardia]|uniref:hypothetical protein n=1 Tax=unclassified Nocardia TaxID=2637762 RepID=UPI001CE45750|nr:MULTISPECIES: hypothetical protein [unclassified Nocardia]
MGAVHISRRGGLLVVAPDGAPIVLDAEPGLDTSVLEVPGGHLTWSLLGGERIPAAVLDDPDTAQDWLWAVYGERIAMALADFGGGAIEVDTDPVLPELVANAWRLGYAHWAARWWPASTVDSIAPLDARLLAEEIAGLTAECELLTDGADAVVDDPDRTTIGRAEDYALAAGPGAAGASLVLARGTGGWEWLRCPPGLLDASERAVTWEVMREAGRNIVQVSVVAAPRIPVEVPAHLHPRAAIAASGGTVDVQLTRSGELWSSISAAPPEAETGVAVHIYVPGLPERADPGGAAARQRVRDFAALRLRRALAGGDTAADGPLLAEIAAANSDSDF